MFRQKPSPPTTPRSRYIRCGPSRGSERVGETSTSTTRRGNKRVVQYFQINGRIAMYHDFAAIKAAVSFGQVVSMLNLNGKQHNHQWRGPCSACNSGGERALVITEGKGFYCFASKKGGDQIALVAHIRDI